MLGTLGYLTLNQLSGYPLKDGRSQGIPDAWFADALVSLFDSSIARVYISAISWNTTVTPGINITLTGVRQDSSTIALVSTTIDGGHVIDMTDINAVYSFWGYSNSKAAVKLVIGPALIGFYNSQASFSTTYTISQGELSANALVLTHPKVTSFTAKTIGDVSPTTITSGNPVVLGSEGYNATITTATNGTAFDIDVVPAAGLGLYRNCPGEGNTPLTKVFSINKTAPTADGNLFLKFSDCYSVDVTKETDVFVDPTAMVLVYTPEITPYIDGVDFKTLDSTKVIVDGPTVAGHGLKVANTCSAKCSPAHMNAFAEYLNRVKDGVKDLFNFVTDVARGSVSTSGTCVPVNGTNILTASSFSNLNTFTPYLHEGRSISIVYSSAHVEKASIVTVLSGTQVVLSRSDLPTPTIHETSVTFTVDDLGVYEKINNAVISYNLESAQFTLPYANIIYSTTEGLNNAGVYGTFISIVATVYNPSSAPLTFNVSYGYNPYILEVPSSTKTIIGDSVYYDATTGTLGCKTYATVQKSLFVPCGGLLGAVDVSVINTTTHTQISSGALNISLNSTPCPPSLTSPTDVYTYTGNSSFCYVITGLNGLATVDYTGLPSWATVDTHVPPTSCSLSGTPTETVNKIYPITVNLYNSVEVSSSAVVNLHVTAPAILSAVTDQTLQQGTAYSYTLSAVNYVEDSSNNIHTVFSVVPGYSLPTGLSLNSTTGIISGTPTTVGTTSVLLSAANYSGATLIGTASQQPANFTVATSATIPQIVSVLTDFVTTSTAYTYQILASENPTFYNALVGGNPITTIGLSINTSTGFITGTPTVSNSYNIAISATNAVGTATATLVLLVGLKPVITSPTSLTLMVGVPTTTTITASNAPTSYGAVNLPPGLAFTAPNTISGTPTTVGVYNPTLTAGNLIGQGLLTVPIMVVGAPAIYSPLSDTVVESSPYYYAIGAYNHPTTYSASYAGTGGLIGLGLTVDTTLGIISGTVPSSVAIGNYTVVISASNAYGTDTKNLVLTIVAAGTVGGIPTITSLTSATALVGASFNYTITATNSPTAYTATSVPALSTAGLSFNTSTGVISGTPTASGVFNITLGASNSHGVANSVNLKLTIYAIPVITSDLSPVYLSMGSSSFSYTITATGIPTSFSATNLPSGMTIDNTTGIISGSPAGSGVYTVTLIASNPAGTASTSKTFNVAAQLQILSTGPYYAVQSQAFSLTLLTSGPFISSSATGLPPGLSFSAGVLSGTPTTVGSYIITFSISSATQTATLAVGFYVVAGMSILNASSTTWAQSTIPLNYSIVCDVPTAILSATSAPSGALPAGMTLGSNGVITVTAATAPSTYNLLLYATLSGYTISEAVSITVSALPAPNPAVSSGYSLTSVYGSGNTVLFSSSISGALPLTGASASSLPSGSTWNLDSLSSASDIISVTIPPALAVGSYSGASISMTNPSGTVSNSFTFVVQAQTTPVLNMYSGSATSIVGNASTTLFNSTDVKNFPLSSITVSGLPTGASYVVNTLNGPIYTQLLAITFSSSVAAGTYSVSIVSTNSFGTGTLNVTYTVAAQTLANAMFSTSGLEDWLYPSNWSTAIQSSDPYNYPLSGFSISGLPTGASYVVNSLPGPANNTVATVTFTTAVLPGTYSTTVSATNTAGTGTTSLAFKIDAPTPSFSTPDIIATSGIAGSYTFVDAVNCLTTWAVVPSGSLPSGFSLNSSTGVMSWTSGAASSDSITSVNIQATNYGGIQTTNSVNIITIHTAPSVSNVSAGSTITGTMSSGFSYSGSSSIYLNTVTFTGFAYYTGNLSPLTHSGYTSNFGGSGVYSGSDLYNQIAINGSGVISALPTASYSCTLTTINALGSYTRAVTLTFNGPPLPAWSLVAPSGTNGVAYTDSLTYQTGYTPYPAPVSYSYDSLPPGLSFNTSTGVLSGTPSSSGSFTVNYTLTGSDGQTYTRSRQYSFA